MQLKIVERGQMNALVSFDEWKYRETDECLPPSETETGRWEGARGKGAEKARVDATCSGTSMCRREKQVREKSQRIASSGRFYNFLWQSTNTSIMWEHVRWSDVLVCQMWSNVGETVKVIMFSTRQLANTILRHFNYPTDRFMVSTNEEKKISVQKNPPSTSKLITIPRLLMTRRQEKWNSRESRRKSIG